MIDIVRELGDVGPNLVCSSKELAGDGFEGLLRRRRIVLRVRIRVRGRMTRLTIFNLQEILFKI